MNKKQLLLEVRVFHKDKTQEECQAAVDPGNPPDDCWEGSY